MRVVVDANIVAAAAVRPDGWTSLQMERTDMRFYAQTLFAKNCRNIRRSWPFGQTAHRTNGALGSSVFSGASH